MKKNLLFIFIIFSNFTFSQVKPDFKMGSFITAQADIGLDLGSIWRAKNSDFNYGYYESPPMYYTHGLATQIGFQPKNWIAIAGGLRYSYVGLKFHNLYWSIQPYFFLTPPENKEFGYFTLQLGKQFNKTHGLTDNAFMGLGFGKFDIIDTRLAQKIQLNLDVQMANDAIWFVGFSYGITIFTNRNL